MSSQSAAADKLEIRDALQRYCRGLDRRDEEMALSAFHPDSMVRHGLFSGTGHDWVRFVLSAPVIDRIGIGEADPALDVVESQQHHVTNQLVELHGESAYSEAYFLEHTMSRRGDKRYLTSVGGRYAERYERRHGQWRIIERHAVRDWDSVAPIETRAPGWEKSPRGTRDHTDPSYWSGQAGLVPPRSDDAGPAHVTPVPARPPAVAPFPGLVRQIAFVVHDLDQAIHDWLTLGVGPWFVLRGFRAVGSTYRDEAFDPLLSLAFANSGDLQVELIAADDDVPSIYREFLDSGRQGFHHVAYWTADVAAAHEAALAQGWQSVQSGSLPFRYYEVSNALGLVVEVSVLNDRMLAISTGIRAAAQEWDGLDRPVRDYPPPSALAAG